MSIIALALAGWALAWMSAHAEDGSTANVVLAVLGLALSLTAAGFALGTLL